MKKSPIAQILFLSLISLLMLSVTTNSVFAQAEIHPSNVVWSPDGTMIAVSGGEAGCQGDTDKFAIPIYSATTGELVKTLLGMDCTIMWLDWNPDGTRLLGVTSPESLIYIWDVVTEELLFSFPTNTQGISMALWSPYGNVIASTFGGGGIEFWNPDTGQRIQPDFGGTTFDWNSNETQVVVGSLYGNSIYITDVTTGEDVMTFLACPQ